MFKKILNQIRKPRFKYDALVKISIHKNALLHNLHEYQKKYPKLEFAPVLKSNAYGHGLVEVAGILDKQDIGFFAVDSFYEALVLRRARIKTKILIIGYTRPEIIFRKTLRDISYTIISLETLREIASKLKIPQKIHLKIDTGMHRQGIMPDEVPEAVKILQSNSNIRLEGLATHFADADDLDQTFTRQQISKWNRIVKIFKEEFPNIKFFHAAATAGTYYSEALDANIVRLGIGLYGVNASPFAKIELQPVLEMRSVISSIKTIGAREKVGYGIAFESHQPIKVATVPTGYNEGVDIRLSNKGFFKVHDVFCPIIGRVSMNITTIDVSEIPELKVEDGVVIFSRSRDDKNSVENVARLCDTIPYETFVHIPTYLRREII